METNLNPIPFNFESHQVRAFDRDGEVWFIAADVCAALAIRNPRDAVAKLDDDEKATVGNSDGQAGRGAQSYNIISEPGLYRLTLTSRKEAAKRFARWVTHEVLPQIRKTGQYQAPETHPVLIPEEPDVDYFRTNLSAMITHIEVIERYWRLEIGPAVAVLNPKIHGIFHGHLATTKALNQRLINRL